MKLLRIFLFALILSNLSATIAQDTIPKDVLSFRSELDQAYRNPNESPLAKDDIVDFKGHDFFTFNDTFRILARFIKLEEPETFEMSTSSGKIRKYDKYARLEFEVKGKPHELFVYQSHRLREIEGYKDYLFLPFKDHTNGLQSYGGGRYVDLRIPEHEKILLDFNQSYNPYCAYRDGFSCPIPPKENHLELKVNAGILKL